MNVNYKNTNENTNKLFVTESDGLTLDYEEIHNGIIRGKEDIRCGRYTDLKTGMENLKRMLLDA